MIKQVALFRRRPDITLDAFHAYWRDRHSKVALRIPGIVRYVQNHVLVSEGQGHPAFDAVAEVWFESMEVLRANTGIPELALVAEDETHFIDADSMQVIIADELVLDASSPPSSPVKLLRFSKRSSDRAPEAFFDAYRQLPVPVTATRAEQNHCRRGGYSKGREPAIDALSIEWYADEATAVTARDDSDRQALEDPQRSGSLLAREIVIRA